MVDFRLNTIKTIEYTMNGKNTTIPFIMLTENVCEIDDRNDTKHAVIRTGFAIKRISQIKKPNTAVSISGEIITNKTTTNQI